MPSVDLFLLVVYLAKTNCTYAIAIFVASQRFALTSMNDVRTLKLCTIRHACRCIYKCTYDFNHNSVYILNTCNPNVGSACFLFLGMPCSQDNHSTIDVGGFYSI